MSELVVEPDSLRAFAERCRTVSGEFSDAAVVQWLSPSTPSVQGSLLSSSLMGADGALSVAMARTVETLDEFATNLVQSAGTYEETDASNADAIAAAFE